jgi:hypothetical protein
MKIWLDDAKCSSDGCNVCRHSRDLRPIPEGYTHASTIQQAKALMLTHDIEEVSLDHDLGACPACLEATIGHPPPYLDEDIAWLEKTGYQSMPNCEHVGTGYQLCVWMADNNIWPEKKPRVHSRNTDCRKRMEGVIDRYFQSAEPSEYDPGL